MQHAYKTTDLAPEERVAVERLLGRTLENDESVELIIHKIDDLRREAICRDGGVSFSEHRRGTYSHHTGVGHWE